MIRRAPRRDRWVVIDNATVRDERLSWKARGLLAYLLSMPDNWTARTEDLAQRGPDGREAVRTGLVELQEAGYLVREKVRRDDGTFEWYATIHERPLCPESDYPSLDEPSTVDPEAENRPVSSTQEEVPIQDQDMAPIELLPETRPEPVAPRARARDALFEVVAEVCGIDWRKLTKRARDALNAAVGDIRPVWDGTEGEIRRKAAEYRGRMPDSPLTPNALAKWYPALNGNPRTLPGGKGAIVEAVAERLAEGA